MIANHKGEIPFVVLLLPFLAGIWLGFYIPLADYLSCTVISIFLLAILFIFLNLTYTKFQIYKARWIGGLIIHLLLFFIGWFCVVQNNELNLPAHFSKHPSQYLITRINSEPILKNGLVRFTGVVEHQKNKQQVNQSCGTLLVSIKDSLASRLQYGDELLIPSNYTAVDPPYNPAEFNYKQYLAHQNIFNQAYLFAGQYAVIEHHKGNPVIAYALKLRQRLVAKLKTNLHDTSAINVASTLILGYKADLSNDLLQAYSKTGTIHILSVSGGHVAIIYLMLSVLLGFLSRYKHGNLVRALIILSLIWYYSLLTGFSPAVCRAAVMISFVIIGKTYNRYINTLNILAVSAFFLLLYNPLFIVDVGFQLSYLSVAGMIILQLLIYKKLNFKTRWAAKLWAACSVSIAAQVVTFPLCAFYFHQFPVYFLISNLFIIIPAELILLVGFIYLALPQLPIIYQALGWTLERLIIIMNKTLLMLESAPFATINKIWFTVAEGILTYVIIFLMAYFLFKRKVQLLQISLSLLLIFSLSSSFKKLNSFNTDSLTFLNLRKHSGMVFKHGDKAIIISDLPLTDKNYQYSIQPYLDSIKVSDTTVRTISTNIKSSFLNKQNNLIQFNKLKVLVFDKSLQHLTLQHNCVSITSS